MTNGAFAPVVAKAIALNTGHLDGEAAERAIEQVREETGLPCTDTVRFGADLLVNTVIGD